MIRFLNFTNHPHGSFPARPTVARCIQMRGSEFPAGERARRTQATFVAADVYDDVVQALAACAAKVLLARVPVAP
jgi:hypothetical protein